MALSRWSFSDHYIYDTGDSENGLPEITVCGFGQFEISDILNNYVNIENKAKEQGYGLFSRLELRAYLTLWARLENRSLAYKDAAVLINILRMMGHIRMYVREPIPDTNLKDIDSIQYYFKTIIEYIEFKLFPEYHAFKESNRLLEVEKWRRERKRK